ncbi:cyclodeaminase/cyclohydrolase family protein [Candidatus Micrarchaeota archaeon]|nr:cyclodeaminase/cyclohydrolase family protein [Candidatus Micrarchaeota archaeon]
MEKKLVEKKVVDFVDQVASDVPAPGGGSVSALSAALGAGLLVMAIRISVKKESNQILSDFLPRLEKEKNRLMQLVDDDTAAFNHVLAAFALPKGTDADKAKRSEAVQTAFQHAASVPLETMQSSLRVLEAGQTVAQLCSPTVASDVGTGIQMVYAGLQGAGYNVNINLSSIKDDEFKAGLEKELDAVLPLAEKQKSNALAIIQTKI